ncbi:MAG: hypothetical protein JG776_963 [Caloramator sp.]|uniref:cell wall-binding repeat-containing protein n=1 Tax=Caloramator sp. TaxID=1871330 RepID=UPI001D516E54|nr:cell wall-binding repeat-containing protein [Caloramator sp.]MBZ4663261.1 hypothetical protein [Caloramator sp.]
MKFKKILLQTVAGILITTNIAFAQSLQGLKIILDSGHGGDDPGAKAKIGDVVYCEKDLNNLITQKLSDILKSYGAEVIFTRDPYQDYAVGLYERPEIANNSGAQIFISIHQNSVKDIPTANGVEVYYSSNRPNIKSTKYVEFNGAKYEYLRETKEDDVEYVYVLVDGVEAKIEKSKVKIITSTTPWQVLESKKLAQMVVSNLSSLGLKNRGAKDSSYVVTKYTTMPSILVETGFMSNPTELLKLVDENFQMQAAQKIADAIKEYYAVYEKNKEFFIKESIEITKRIAGENRYKTNLAILDEGWQSAENIILAYGEDYADALTAAALSKKLDAPIILTKGNVLEEEVKDKVIKLGVKNAYIIGGQAVISNQVEDTLKNLGIKVTRIAGSDRYKTSVEIAKYFESPKEAFLVTGRGFADALSVSTIASYREVPILFVDNNKFEDALEYVKTNGIERVYVIGGEKAVSNEVTDKFSNYQRIFGKDRYETNIEIIKAFEGEFDFSKIFISTGENYPDALSATSLSVKNNNPIFLCGSGVSGNDYIKKYIEYFQEVVVVGGERMLPKDYIFKMFN